jgi:hypothetical protein
MVQALPVSLCKRGDTLYTPTVELTKGEKRVLILGFVHIGPHIYYQDQKFKISQWLHEHPGKTTILTEHYTCVKSVFAIKPSLVSNDEITFLSNRQQIGLPDLLGMGDHFEASACILAHDGKTLRPTYVVEAEKELAELAMEAKVDAQWWMDYSNYSDTVTKSGDLIMDRESPIAQITGSMAYRDLVYFDDNTHDNYLVLFERFMVSTRNTNLVANILEELKTKDQVILPWGAAHREGLEQILAIQGFAVTKRGFTRYGTATDFHESKFKKDFFSNLEDAQENSPLCWPSVEQRK